MRRGEPPRRSGSLRRSAMKSRYKRTGPSPEVVDAVLERASHSCEICGSGLGDRRVDDWQIQHRRPRGNGGTLRPETNWPSNLMLLCPGCHLDGDEAVESRREAALAAGWLVHQGDDPATVPVVIHGPRLVYLTVDGRYSDDPPGED